MGDRKKKIEDDKSLLCLNFILTVWEVDWGIFIFIKGREEFFWKSLGKMFHVEIAIISAPVYIIKIDLKE